MMNEIKFSHDYLKLPKGWVGTTAKLLFVRKICLEHQTTAFLRHDTEYQGRDGTGFYALPEKGEYLYLLFEHQSGALFTTLRRETPEKYEYYKANLRGLFRLAKIEGD